MFDMPGSDSGSPRIAGKTESNRETGQRKEAQDGSSLSPAGGEAGNAKSTLGGSLDVATSASTGTLSADNSDMQERLAAGRSGMLGTSAEVAGSAATVGIPNLKSEMNPGSVWGQGVPGGGGMEWGRPAGAGAGEAGGGVGVTARGLDGARSGGGGNVGGGSSSEEAGNEEWDAGDGTVALRHLQNLAAQLPYSAWQVSLGFDPW